MASVEDFSSVQILYQLSWDHGKLEHPHMIEVQYPSNQDELRLRDVKNRLTTLRGHGIGQSFSWSYKRNYRNTFIWNDLSDDDVIHPLRGSGEYLLKASELMDTSANKPVETLSKYQSEQKQSSQTMSVENAVMKGKKHLGADSPSSSDREDETPNLPTLSMDQDTIDVEKLDFCLSSSDNEISPRPKLADCNTKPVTEQALVAITTSPTVQDLQTPTDSSLTSPAELPFSPGSTKRIWKREIRKSLFRTTSRNITSTVSPVSAAESNATLHVERPTPMVNCTGQEDASLWRHSRSKSITPSNLQALKEEKIEKEAEQHSTSQLIRSLWARWTGGSSKEKRSPPQTKQLPRPCTKSPGKEKRPSSHIEHCHHTTRQSTPVESKSRDYINRIHSVSSLEDSHVTHCLITPKPLVSVTEIANPNSSETELDGDIADIKTAEITQAPVPQLPQHQESRKEKVALSVEIPNLQVDAPDSPTSDTQGGPPEAEIDTPKPALARVKTSYGLPRVKTTSSIRSFPPGFHKGTNDTKPVQTPKRNNIRSYSTPLVSPPPLMRSLSRDSVRSLSAKGASFIPASSPESKDSIPSTPRCANITLALSPESNNSVSSTPSPKNAIMKKCINFSERDERPLQPGLTTLDWEKALQEAVTSCLPPPNFGDILQECSTCGRTFKPDSLQVHKRGCHPPHYSRAFTTRASPHMVRSRAI